MIELVWDAERQGTATASSGMSITVGDRAHFSPDELLAMAAASCLMRTFLRLADEEALPVLSFAATAQAEPACESGGEPSVTIRTFVVAPSTADERALQNLSRRSASISPIVRALGDRVTITSDVRVLWDAQPAAG